jgi:hypothetical protein
MAAEKIESLLQSMFAAEIARLDLPTEDDWKVLTSRFGCEFGADFKDFISLMSKYQFPGDILNVSSGKTNGNDLIQIAYDYESKSRHWDAAMIPFYSVGNGDYFCINSTECPDSKVYYYYSEVSTFGVYSTSFEEWIRQLPEFLS